MLDKGGRIYSMKLDNKLIIKSIQKHLVTTSMLLSTISPYVISAESYSIYERQDTSCVVSTIDSDNIIGDSETAGQGEFSQEAADWVKDKHITFIGDSLGVGVESDLSKYLAGANFDVKSSRFLVNQSDKSLSGLDVLKDLVKQSKVRETLVVALGTNGGLNKADMEAFYKEIPPNVKNLVWINTASRGGSDGYEKIDRESISSTMKSFADSKDNVFYLDWNKYVDNKQDWSKMTTDSVHMNANGNQIYAKFIVQGLYDLFGKTKKDSKSSSKTSNKSGDNSAASSLGDAGGNWLVEGTPENKVAQATFDVLTKDYGLSGTSAAGWMGNIQGESGFSPTATEAENGQNYSGRGYGLYQFTPGSKFINSKYYKKNASLEEEVHNQTAFVWASEFENGTYKSYLPNAQKWFGITATSLDDILDNDDPVEAMLIFFATYERGDVAQMHRERRTAAAKAADKVFNKKKVKADKSKWKTGADSKTVNTTSSNNATSTTGGCGDGTSSSGSTGSGTIDDSGYPTNVPFTITQGIHHLGALDLAAPEGSPIFAVSDGEITEVNRISNGINGNYVIHTLPDGTSIYYGHMRDVPMVKEGQEVKKGQQIGVIGMTGQASGPHIHFDRRVGGNWASGGDPYPLIKITDGKPVGITIDPKSKK